MAPTRHPFRRASSLRTTAADVRICARLSALGAPIRGHLKHVPSDFVVNELRGEDCSEVLLSEPRARAEQQAGDEADEADDEEAPALKRARGESVCAARLRTADESGSAHVRFTLHKIRRGTLEAIALLGAELKLPVRAFSVCGIKDAFAVTTQEVAVRGATAAELRAVQLPEVVVGDARPADGPMRIGGAAGNAFRIRIRGMRTTAAALERMADALRTNGFVNYYGLQRFGQGPVKSHELGRLLLRRDYAQLLETIVCAPAATADMLPSDEREPRAHFNFSRNAALALKSFPRRLRLERELLARLLRDEEHKEAGGSWNSRCRSAILSLPLSKRKLWANAYYSFVFNLCATERIARFGGAVVEGDLVIAGDARPAPGRAAVRISAHPPALVSADDVRTGRYSIHDVVLPLMGARVLTPRHEIGLLCRSYVGYDGIDTHTLEVRNSLQRPDGEADAEADGEEADGEEEAGEDEDEGAAGEGGHDGACGTDAEHADGAIGAIGDAGEDEDEDTSGGGCWNHHGDYELRGSYRHIVACAHLLEATPLATEAPTPAEPLRMQFDADSQLNASRAPLPSLYYAAESAADAEPAEPVTDALFTFRLQSGCYATVMLREVVDDGEQGANDQWHASIAADAHAGSGNKCGGNVASLGPSSASGGTARHIRFDDD